MFCFCLLKTDKMKPLKQKKIDKLISLLKNINISPDTIRQYNNIKHIAIIVNKFRFVLDKNLRMNMFRNNCKDCKITWKTKDDHMMCRNVIKIFNMKSL